LETTVALGLMLSTWPEIVRFGMASNVKATV